MPFGLVTMKISTTHAGDSVALTVYLNLPADVNAKVYKYDSINLWSDYSYYSEFSQDRKSVVVYLKDGGYGDADGKANRIIVDPIGFGIGSMIKGTITDNGNDDLIRNATITVEDITLKTNEKGEYIGMIYPGTYVIEAAATCYDTTGMEKTIDVGETIEINFTLNPIDDCEPYIPSDSPSGGGGSSSSGPCFINTIYF